MCAFSGTRALGMGRAAPGRSERVAASTVRNINASSKTSHAPQPAQAQQS